MLGTRVYGCHRWGRIVCIRNFVRRGGVFLVRVGAFGDEFGIGIGVGFVGYGI